MITKRKLQSVEAVKFVESDDFTSQSINTIKESVNQLNEDSKIKISISDLEGNLIETDRFLLYFDKDSNTLRINNFL